MIEATEGKAAPARLLNVIERFDAGKVWGALSAAERAAIGLAALDLVAAWHMQEQSCAGDPGDVLQRLGEHIDQRAIAELQGAFVDAVPRSALETSDGQPRIPVSVGMVCDSCGCSELNACPGGCGWAHANRCTACERP